MTIAPSNTSAESPPPRDITLLLHDIASGDARAAATLAEAVYAQLRAAAQQEMAHERPNHTLSATALVHEAYVKLAGPREVPWANRAHFYAAAAEAMRRILLDSAKRRGRQKRGGGAKALSLDVDALHALREPNHSEAEDAGLDVLALDEAVAALARHDPRAAQVVRLKFFAGLAAHEVALALGVSERTIKADWSFARAWITRHVASQPIDTEQP
jgi:RNA polymerase sigma factor (TIGR02999 family)